MRKRVVSVGKKPIPKSKNKPKGKKIQRKGYSFRGRKKLSRLYQPKRRVVVTFNSLSDDMLFKIYQFIALIESCRLSRIAKRFNNSVHLQNNLWKNLCISSFKDLNRKNRNNAQTQINWKQNYISSFKTFKMNKIIRFCNKIIHQAQINHTLPNTKKLISNLKIHYTVFINDMIVPHDRYTTPNKQQNIRSFELCDILKIHNNDILLQFTLSNIKTVTIKMNSNKFFKPLEISFDILKLNKINNHINNKTSVIKLFQSKNIRFAVYDVDNIAFITINLNHLNLLSLITPQIFYKEEIEKENINFEQNKNNFYGWKLQIMFRNLKKIYFNSKFYELIPIFTKSKSKKLNNNNQNVVEFQLIGNKTMDYLKINSFPMYPWKNDVFNGKEIGVFEIDISLLNHNNNIIVANSLMVNCNIIQDLYNFDDQCHGDKRYMFTYNNPNKNETFVSLIGNIIVTDTNNENCNLQNLSLFLNVSS